MINKTAEHVTNTMKDNWYFFLSGQVVKAGSYTLMFTSKDNAITLMFIIMDDKTYINMNQRIPNFELLGAVSVLVQDDFDTELFVLIPLHKVVERMKVKAFKELIELYQNHIKAQGDAQ